jgi:hypothetical protein
VLPTLTDQQSLDGHNPYKTRAKCSETEDAIVMKYQIILATFACSILASCATPYQEMGLKSGVKGLMGGVKATRIDETTVQIAASGNAFSDKDTISLYALRKAAETTVANGYDGFYIVSEHDRTRNYTHITPGYSTTSYSGTATGVGYNTAHISGSGTTTYTPPVTTNFIKPGQALTIKMFKGTKQTNASGVYDAHELLRFMVPIKQTKGSKDLVTTTASSPLQNPYPAEKTVPLSKPATLEEALQKIAQNAKVPMDMGENTIMTKAESIGTQLTLTANILGDSPLIRQYENMAQQICTYEEQYQVLRAGATVRVIYLSAKGENVGAITVTKQACGL